MSAEEARKPSSMAQVVDEARKQPPPSRSRRSRTPPRPRPRRRAKRILGTAIQRYAGEYVAERTVSVVPLPSDDLKGRIIGREGRNIRALEAATGIDLIIDDTPEAVIISCFNPVRREIAKLALTRLIADGRIHPTRIEEVVAKCTDEVEAQCKEAGEQAVFDLGLHKVHPELVRAARPPASSARPTRRTCCSTRSRSASSPASWPPSSASTSSSRAAPACCTTSARASTTRSRARTPWSARSWRASSTSRRRSCAAIAEHHGEEPHTSVLSHIVDAANVLSGQRPGARQELLASYVQRLDDLEKLGRAFDGVQKAFAIQAGREVRVIVENAQVTDEQAMLLAKDIAKRIENEATYAGQVRVSVIRETRSTDYARVIVLAIGDVIGTPRPRRSARRPAGGAREARRRRGRRQRRELRRRPRHHARDRRRSRSRSASTSSPAATTPGNTGSTARISSHTRARCARSTIPRRPAAASASTPRATAAPYAVVNLIGRTFMEPVENPFRAVERALDELARPTRASSSSTCTPRRRARSAPWAGTSTAASASSGARTPTCRPPTRRSCPAAPPTSATSA